MGKDIMPSNSKMASNLFLDLLVSPSNLVGKDYTKAIQIYKDLFMLYDYKQLAGDIPEVPAESFSNADQLTHEMNVTAIGNSSSFPDSSQADSSQVQTVRIAEMSEAEVLNDDAVNDHLSLLGEVTPLEDEENNEKSPMDAAAIEPSSPLTEMATPSLDLESQTTNTPENQLGDQLLK